MAIAEHVTLGASPGFDPGGPKFLSPAGGRAGRSPARVALKSDDRPAVHAERRVAASAGKANCRRNMGLRFGIVSSSRSESASDAASPTSRERIRM